MTDCRTHSITPELCSTCAGLRSTSIIDQTPLGVAVRAQAADIIALLIGCGADVNLADDDGNTPLMLAVRESPVSWECVEALVFFGAKYATHRCGLSTVGYPNSNGLKYSKKSQ